ncbi:MAG: tRNA-intron lyase [Promethearchaeia archaeon]
MTENSKKNKEKIQFEGFFKGDKVLIYDPAAIAEFYKGSYIGNIEKDDKGNEILVLDPLESLLLCERKRLLLRKNNDKSNEPLDFEQLLTYFTNYDERLWFKYIIYMDLRKRGYIVRTGYGDGIDFRVYKRGADFENDSAKYLIYPVFEGNPIELKDLDKMSRIAMSSRKDLIIATVDRLSKPIYYSVTKFQILQKEENND